MASSNSPPPRLTPPRGRRNTSRGSPSKTGLVDSSRGSATNSTSSGSSWGVLKNLFSASGQIAVSAAGMIAALATVLTLTFFLLLGSERYVNFGVGLFPEAHQPLVRRLLSRSAGAISGYITGNLAISVICGVTTFIVLLLL